MRQNQVSAFEAEHVIHLLLKLIIMIADNVGKGDLCDRTRLCWKTCDDTEVDFSKHRKGKGEFNFSGYLFPKEGNVKFSRSIFGDGGVNFTFANFGQGVWLLAFLF
ncbi:hypothetical protein BJAS_P4717 [Bathymodiolus japonicus methanotrophic gill symbiont]|uniref:hypothetical protein n=1 Tax=Bathymodiolus japonicus methanotrophic gill symbiont TaxID=113269 RepID=UPI001B5BA7DF|nr:hypothetical protein [Bathymodiolus japonicus methanotrophic gill symbiont]GFO73725.1 hypothetical protein BJAS_P4717 [Bathymodiolus japonicus methanotrophic gill symbiont]